MRLLYWKTSPKRLVGCIVARSFIADAGVASRYSKSHSMSCRGIPVHAQMRCFTSTWLVVAASPSLNAGYTELLHPAGDEVLHHGDPLLVQRVRLLPGEALALIALWTQARHAQSELRRALLERRVGRVDQDRDPVRVRPPRLTEDGRALVRRRLVLVELPLLPAVQRSLRLHELQRTLRLGAIGGPGGGDRGVRVLRSRDV